MPDSPLRLPPLQQTLLDGSTVDALFADLAAFARVLAVIPKRSIRTMTEEPAIDLAGARAGLRDGTLRGAQIRYRYDDREWCDTLMAGPAGAVRLVRICTDDVADTTG